MKGDPSSLSESETPPWVRQLARSRTQKKCSMIYFSFYTMFRVIGSL